MPYPSIELLTAAARDLSGCHGLTVISAPALLRESSRLGKPPTDLLPFGSGQEKEILEAFKVIDGDKPYLAVWNERPALVNATYGGTTLQRQRTRDPIGLGMFRDNSGPSQNKRTEFALRPDAGQYLVDKKFPAVYKVSLAVWLGRHEDFADIDELCSWFDSTCPTQGTDLDLFYRNDVSMGLRAVQDPFVATPPSNDEILDAFNLAPESPADIHTEEAYDVMPLDEESLTWTQSVCEHTLPDADTEAITARVLTLLRDKNVELPDDERLVRRCVVALLVGHLVLQGPPGTGKTTLARALAKGFEAHLHQTTATSDWSPFHVVGGLRPNVDGGLSPIRGHVVAAAINCAERVRADVATDDELGELQLSFDGDDSDSGEKMTWLFIDEFNRADIDKAIGSLFTVLASCDPAHLIETPVDLWYETEPEAKKVWFSSRFRIVAAMNDLDTSFVNRMSQGLTRRFQFVTVNAPSIRGTDDRPVTSEISAATRGAFAWLENTYGSILTIPSYEEAETQLADSLVQLQQLVDGLRKPSSAAGWQVGTAQVKDVLQVVLLRMVSGGPDNLKDILDEAIADRLVPQMAGVDDAQAEAFKAQWESLGFQSASASLTHLINPHETP